MLDAKPVHLILQKRLNNATSAFPSSRLVIEQRELQKTSKAYDLQRLEPLIGGADVWLSWYNGLNDVKRV